MKLERVETGPPKFVLCPLETKMTQNNEDFQEAASNEAITNPKVAGAKMSLLVDEELQDSQSMALQPYSEQTQLEFAVRWIGKIGGNLPKGVAFFFISAMTSLIFVSSGSNLENGHRYVITVFSFGFAGQIVEIIGEPWRRRR
jgi:hypothetical protein